MTFSLRRPYDLLRRAIRKTISRFVHSAPKPKPADTRPAEPEPAPQEKSVYQQLTPALTKPLDSNGQYWWQTSGNLLAALLTDAGYTIPSQQQILTFFANTIVPHLGPTYTPSSPQWPSFMTDDHHPIELSWDWHTGHKAPTVRFSIEPVGIHAGTPADPNNEQADPSFRQALLNALPQTDTTWFTHFDQHLSPPTPSGVMEGHRSKIFYAFDLTGTSITSKAYFFPGFKARESGQTNIEVIRDAISTAPEPQITTGQLASLEIFEDFINDPLTPALEIDMLALDMDAPSLSSRLKIYFRNRDTSFGSVRRMMTLGERVSGSEMEVGLQKLRALWDALLDQDGVSDLEPLPEAGSSHGHRTGGMLYNVELRAGAAPKVKIYIPVRHYARCDGVVVEVVHGVMPADRGQGSQGEGRNGSGSRPERGKPEALQQRGIHTYVGCSVQSGGELRVVSYLNGQGQKMVR
ncbi:tryptophan dimethylallyltransferase-domain-containing protein [Aspergillus karnatakaensis]|uniref:tryptophan dimethylallyltransferase-domain-containing protein n=1 Tax=Aspergillus karnatakaensis TaxID=1810916 RepID=UPI003CCDAD91